MHGRPQDRSRHTASLRSRAWPLLWLLVAPAQAQDPDGRDAGDEPVAEEGPAEPVEDGLAARVVSLREGWAWLQLGPRDVGAMTELAVHPGNPEVIAVVAASGAAWRTDDGGVRWRQILPPMVASLGDATRDEDLLLATEARIEELTADVTVPEDSDFPDDAFDDPEELESELASESQAAIDEAVTEVETELQTDAWFLTEAGDVRAVRSRIWLGAEDQVLVGRSDGTWLSRDGGARWRAVLDEQVTALVRVPMTGLWVAGTSDGVRLSTDLLHWIDIEDGTEGVRVYELALFDNGVYAATMRGLWYAPDGERFSRLSPLDVAMLEVGGDPAEPAWVSTGSELLRVTPDGMELDEDHAAPLAGVVSLVPLGSGHLLVGGAEGVWESVDGGATWLRLSRGLAEAGSHALLSVGGTVWLGNDLGLFRLDPTAPDAVPRPTLTEVMADFPPLEALVETSLARDGVHREGDMARKFRVASAMPQLRVEARATPGGKLRWRPTFATTRDRTGDLAVFARLDWTPNRRRTVSDDSTDVLVLGNAVSVVGDPGDQRVVMARLDRVYANRSHTLVELIGEYYRRRLELLRLRADLATSALQRQVVNELDIAEVEAHLDALTGGAVTRWRTAPRTDQEE